MLKYGCCGSGVLIDGLTGSVADSVGHVGKVAPQPIKLSAQAVSIALVLGRTRLGFFDSGICVLPVVFSEFQGGLGRRGDGFCMLSLEVGDLPAVAPGLHLPACAKGQYASDGSGCNVCTEWNQSHHLHQLIHMARMIGFMSGPFRTIRAPLPCA